MKCRLHCTPDCFCIPSKVQRRKKSNSEYASNKFSVMLFCYWALPTFFDVCSKQPHRLLSDLVTSLSLKTSKEIMRKFSNIGWTCVLSAQLYVKCCHLNTLPPEHRCQICNLTLGVSPALKGVSPVHFRIEDFCLGSQAIGKQVRTSV